MRRFQPILGFLAVAVMMSAGLASDRAVAQAGPNGLINPNRDCQTILRCNFARSGSYRGCISAYSCRVCKLVRANCAIGNVRANCERMRCSWG